MMLWGYFDCCCCVTNNPRTCCKETTFLFCSSPWGTELQEGLHWIDLLCGLPRLHWDVGLICHYLKDCGWTRYESQMEAVTWELGHVQGMLQHSGPWNGKLLSWWSSFARLSVPMEAGGMHWQADSLPVHHLGNPFSWFSYWNIFTCSLLAVQARNRRIIHITLSLLTSNPSEHFITSSL